MRAVTWPESRICRWRFLPGRSWGGGQSHHGKKKTTTRIETKLTINTDFVRRFKLTISKCFRYPPGEVCPSRVGAGSAEEDPVVWVPPEEAGGGALGSPTLPRCQGTLIRINAWKCDGAVLLYYYVVFLLFDYTKPRSSSLIQLTLSNNVLLLYFCPYISSWSIRFVFVLLFKSRIVARSMKGSTSSVSQWTPQRTLNWSKLLSEYKQLMFEYIPVLRQEV